MSRLASWLASPPPDAAVEMSPECVSVTMLGSRGGRPVVQAYATEPVPAGAIVPSLTDPNVIDGPAVLTALRAALSHLGANPRRVALVIPDVCARVSLIRFDRIPARREDLDQLIRWQMKKAAPFPIEEACLSQSAGVRDGESGEFVVVLARRAMVREYEGLCEQAGLHAGLVDLSTLSLLNLYLASGEPPRGDWMAVHIRPGYTSTALLRGSDVIFFRTRADGEQESLTDVVHQTMMYYQDRLSGQALTRVVVGGRERAPGAIERARREIEGRLGMGTEPIGPGPVTFADRISPEPALVDTLAPSLGVLLRTQKSAVS